MPLPAPKKIETSQVDIFAVAKSILLSPSKSVETVPNLAAPEITLVVEPNEPCSA